ncbi:MAG: (d)CMP kinase [Candidatus Omnitrophica bacterium]|nr:(d)CMP kinase [Candidatus Omnitrophota bacterium]
MDHIVKVIAIDGPAGSGKSTVAKMVAAKLGFLYIDTGAMYRALTLKAVNEGVDLENANLLEELSKITDIKLEPVDSGVQVFLDGEDVSEKIRELSISEKVKYIARVEGVRENMVKKQRSLGLDSNGAVLEGRDIGTVVFPDSKCKIFLDANFEERVNRRYKEFIEKGKSTTLEAISEDLKNRDHADFTRKAGPLKKAKDSIVIDTTGLTIDQVVEVILQHGKKLYDL